jgi:crossover junction endodeoxyribonuclease RuvC
MRILGIDPGTLTMGYGVIEGDEDALDTVDYGVLTCSNRDPIAVRLSQLYKGLQELFGRYRPDEVAIEEPFVAKNARSALAVGRAQAIAILAAANNQAPIFTYTPTKVKQAVTDYGVCGKEQIQRMVQIQLGLGAVPQPSDAADALSVALCHLRQKRFEMILAESEAYK